jgi:DNA-binding CsgD family transcriptional regulator
VCSQPFLPGCSVAGPSLTAASAPPPWDGPAGVLPGVETVLTQALDWLDRCVGFDAARALAYDPDVLIPVSLTAREPLLDQEHVVAACWNEQAEADVCKFTDLARSPQHVAVLTVEQAEARQSSRWRNLIIPDGWCHELRAVAVDERGHCWGSVTAFREGRRAFTARDTAAVNRELSQIACRLSRAMVGGAAPPEPGGSASLWLREAGELRFATPAAREWLARLQGPDMPGRADTILAGLAVKVATAIASSGPDGVPRPVSLRARGVRGQWIGLYGEPVTEPGGQVEGISVVIGPARPAVVLPMLAAAYGLTAREQMVIRGVLAGQSTRQISASLHISGYTVQDHLKAIFAKVGVSSRGELAHRLALQFT